MQTAPQDQRPEGKATLEAPFCAGYNIAPMGSPLTVVVATDFLILGEAISPTVPSMQGQHDTTGCAIVAEGLVMTPA